MTPSTSFMPFSNTVSVPDIPWIIKSSASGISNINSIIAYASCFCIPALINLTAKIFLALK